MEILKQFANAAEGGEKEGILGVLGIDWMTLIFQIGAFLVLVWVLQKFVFPWLLKSVDERQAKIEASAQLAAKAQAASEEAEERVQKLLDEAQTEASSIVSSAKAEAANLVASAEEKSKKRAEQIVADAKTEVQKEILAAKEALKKETIELVALATEKVLGKTMSKEIDNKLITQTIKEIE